ncbi:hypothetical protein [Streptomyces sp. S1]|uniref:hypothetical protein n=1 Tax=Streptomyces sp. S1 TaxID=718288 RepID=UPI003D7264F8
MSSDPRPEPGRCTGCGGEAERDSSGAWWHTGRSCELRAPRAVFRPRQQTSPRNRQIQEPRRTR